MENNNDIHLHVFGKEKIKSSNISKILLWQVLPNVFRILVRIEREKKCLMVGLK